MSVRVEEGRAVVARLTGAGVRALLMMLVIATPSVLLPGTGADGKQMVALVALFAGALVFVEYNATYPGLIEFRDAPPFNRIRFLILFFTVFSLTVIARDATQPTTLSTLVAVLGALIGNAMDFPFSPVRLATLLLADGATDQQVMAVRAAAGISYLVSLIGLAVFVVLMKRNAWPTRSGGFNVWVNLPTFDPTTGGDVVTRLDRDAHVNIAFGFLLPFVTPMVVNIASIGFEPLTLTAPQTLIWTMTIWAFLPASLFMRGIAMNRIAEMIRDKRRDSGVLGQAGYIPA